MAKGTKRAHSGGQRQRLAQAAAEERWNGVGSVLVQYLLSQMLWGAMSPQQAQHIAHLAQKDMDAAPENCKPREELDRLAATGCSGAYPNKVYHDIMRNCIPNIGLPRPFLFKLPYKEPLGELLQSCLLPHEVFSSIYNNYKATWRKCVHPSNEACEKFWLAMDGHPATTDGIKCRENYKTHCVPLALHGDGVPLTGIGKGWQQTITDFSFYSLLGQGGTPDLLFFIFAVFDKLRKFGRDNSGTAHRFFEILRWSFLCIWRLARPQDA